MPFKISLTSIVRLRSPCWAGGIMGLDNRPFGVGSNHSTTKAAAVRSKAMFRLPHRALPLANQLHPGSALIESRRTQVHVSENGKVPLNNCNILRDVKCEIANSR